ncbi:MAG: alanine racemase [Bianqueaceae bacterium]
MAATPTSQPRITRIHYYRRQMQQFDEMRSHLRDAGISIAHYHCANSAAALQYPETRLDLVRMGVAIFGIIHPRKSATCPPPENCLICTHPPAQRQKVERATVSGMTMDS